MGIVSQKSWRAYPFKIVKMFGGLPCQQPTVEAAASCTSWGLLDASAVEGLNMITTNTDS